jgi:hypothetical protein
MSDLKQKKKLLLTFDYELFLGKKSGTVLNCMIRPTHEILGILKSQNIKHAIFFVDTSYISRLKEITAEKAKKDYRLLRDQMVTVLKEGHYIFPHLHPHWKDAVYDETQNEWQLNNMRYYRFHNLSEADRREQFSKSIEEIKSIQSESGIHYEIDAYRAGGWCLQPFSDFKPYFLEHNIKYDFSVLRGEKKSNEHIYYDFGTVPLSQIYHFQNEVDREDPKGAFTEFSISSIQFPENMKFKNKIINKILWYKKDRGFGDGRSASTGSDAVVSESPETSGYHEMISVELLNRPKLTVYLKFMERNDYMHFISHPKMLTRHNLKTLRSFLEKVTKRYDLETYYKKMI